MRKEKYQPLLRILRLDVVLLLSCSPFFSVCSMHDTTYTIMCSANTVQEMLCCYVAMQFLFYLYKLHPFHTDDLNLHLNLHPNSVPFTHHIRESQFSDAAAIFHITRVRDAITMVFLNCSSCYFVFSGCEQDDDGGFQVKRRRISS